MHSDSPQPEKLGSLAQQTRQASLGSARGILIAIGILTIVVNVIFFFLSTPEQVKKEVDQELAKEGINRGMLPPQTRKELEDKETQAVKIGQLGSIGFVVVGVAFVVFGILVYRYPVPITVTSLILYIAGQAITAAIDPSMLAKGMLIKIIIILALVRSIQAAIAYEKELKEEKELQEQQGSARTDRMNPDALDNFAK